MSIKNRRIAKLTDEILKASLQAGNLPDSKEFIWLLNRALKGYDLSGPSFSFQAYRNSEVATSQRYNQNNRRIYEDLAILYENIISVHAVLNKYYAEFDVEKRNLETQINQLENELKERIQNYNRGGYLPYAYDTFDTTEKCDLDETDNVFVDTTHHQVRLTEEKNTSLRVYPTVATEFFFYPNAVDKKDRTLTGSLANIPTDNLDEIWQRQICLKEPLAVTGCVQMGFPQAYNLNQIDVALLTVKPCRLKITFTPDGQAWYNLPYYEESVPVLDAYSFQFPAMTALGLRFYVDKTEPDETLPETDGYDNQYLFGFQSIKFYDKQYPTSGVFQSQLLALENKPTNYLVNNVTLSVDEVVPTGTALTYYVSLPYADGTYDWQLLEPKERENVEKARQSLSFSRLTRSTALPLYFPAQYAVSQSQVASLTTNGIPIYRLSYTDTSGAERKNIPSVRLVDKTQKLYVGKNAWEITSFPASDVSGVPNLAEWEAVHDGTQVDYRVVDAVSSGNVLKNYTDSETKKYMCKLGLKLDSPLTFKSYPASTDPMALYVNGELLFAGTEAGQAVNFAFKQGWNEIVVLLNGGNATGAGGITATLGFNPTSLTTTLYSSASPLKYVSLFTLQYNTKINDRSVFSMRETEAGYEILTNFAKPGLACDLYYDYANDTVDEEADGLYLRVDFARDNSPTVPSPVLSRYRLEFT